MLRVSPIYETEPVDYTEQRWFLNLVVEAETELFPMQLLARTAAIERALGRVRTVPNGPRTIDIDILFYGSGGGADGAAGDSASAHGGAALRAGAAGGTGARPAASGDAAQRATDAGKRAARSGPAAV